MGFQFELAKAWVQLETRGQAQTKANLRDIRGQAGQASASFDRVGSSIKRAFDPSVLGAFKIGLASAATAAVQRFVTGGIQNAANAAEIESQFEKVFKDQAAAAEEFAAKLGDDIGRSVTKLKQQLAGLQDTFVPLGFARDRARELSQQMVQLAQDLASFKNEDPTEVVRRLTGALIGNHENVRQYGVIITEASLSQELFRLGMANNSREATEQQKVLARLSLIMQGTTDAQGDAAATADSAANQFRKLSDQLYDLSVNTGERLLPTIVSITEALTKLEPVAKSAGDAIQEALGFDPNHASSVLGISPLRHVLELFGTEVTREPGRRSSPPPAAATPAGPHVLARLPPAITGFSTPGPAVLGQAGGFANFQGPRALGLFGDDESRGRGGVLDLASFHQQLQLSANDPLDLDRERNRQLNAILDGLANLTAAVQTTNPFT